jgi:hypothetical protein
MASSASSRRASGLANALGNMGVVSNSRSGSVASSWLREQYGYNETQEMNQQ